MRTAHLLCAVMFGVSISHADDMNTTLINFGADTNLYDSNTGWNHQKGSLDDSVILHIPTYVRTTTTLQTNENNESGFSVSFAPMTGIDLLGTPVAVNDLPDKNPPPLTGAQKRIQDAWLTAHNVTLDSTEFSSSWVETSGLDIIANPGKITLSGFESNKTYVASAILTRTDLVSLLGSSSLLKWQETGLTVDSVFLVTNHGLTDLATLDLGNLAVADLLGGQTFSLSWVVETGDTANANLKLDFSGDLVKVGGSYALHAMAITEYASKEIALHTMRSGYKPTVDTPEPGTATLGLLALAGLCTRRRRK